MVAMMMNGEGSFRCSLNLSPKVLEVSPIYSSSQVRSSHQNQYMVPTFADHGVFVLEGRPGNIKESIFIRVNNPTLNRNIGQFNLPHIWDRVLLNTPGLTFKRHAQAVRHAKSNTPH